MWNGTPAQCEAFRSVTGISYPILMLAMANGVGSDYMCGADAFFVVDGAGIIRYRRTIQDGPPAWRPAEIGPVVDQALAELASPVGEVPDDDLFVLQNAYPNPFNPTTRIPYLLQGDGSTVEVRLQVLDLRGRVVKTLFAGAQTTGRSYEFLWDGRDDTGRRQPSGTYLSRLAVAGRDQARFLSLVK